MRNTSLEEHIIIALHHLRVAETEVTNHTQDQDIKNNLKQLVETTKYLVDQVKPKL